MRSAKEIMSDGDSSDPLDSQQINMYFTRAQADEIVRLFDQARLLELLQEKTDVVINEPAAAEMDSAPKDPYHEYGEP